MSLFTSDRQFLGLEEATLMSGISWSGSPLSLRQQSSGRLTMPDGSFYEGDFEPRGVFEGEFRHFSGVSISGRFNNGKLVQGEISFPDGDRLQGSFRPRGALWVAGSAKFFRAGESNGEKVETGFTAGTKKIHFAYKDVGFAVEWDKGYESQNKKLERLLLSPSGYFEYTKREGEIINNHKALERLVYPCEQIERAGPTRRNVLVIHPLGFAILPCPNDKCLLTFKGIESIIFKGGYKHSESKLSLKGAIFESGKDKTKELAQLRVKRRTETELYIEMDGVVQESLLVFQKNLILLAEKFSTRRPPSPVKKLPVAGRWTALRSLAVAIASEKDAKC